jgi:hypothetical protein
MTKSTFYLAVGILMVVLAMLQAGMLLKEERR